MPFRDSRRDQTFLLPPSMDDWVPADHPVRFVWELVESLDLDELGIVSVPSPLGASSYPPRELLALWLYGFMDRTRSTRGLEKACRESLPYIWLAGLLRPDHMTFWRFYNANRAAMRDLFRKTVKIAVEQGLVDFAFQAIDGSKITVTSNARLRRKEALEKLLAQVEAEIAAMEEQEASESPDEGSAQRAQRHRAMAKKKEKRVRVQEALDQVEEAEQSQGGQDAKEPRAQTTDPEARVMKTPRGWEVGYNAQVLVDGRNQIIVAADVTQQNYDTHQFIPLLEQEEQELGRCADVTVADSGYFSGANLKHAQGRTDLYVRDSSYEKSVKKASAYHFTKFEYRAEEDVFICPQGKKLTFARCTRGRGKANPGRQYQCHDCDGCPVRDQCTKSKKGRTVRIMADSALLFTHRQKMNSDEARDLMRQRAPLVEAVFGIMKECQEARRFLTHGLYKVQQEWYLLCAAFNLRKLYKYWARNRAAEAQSHLSSLFSAFATWYQIQRDKMIIAITMSSAVIAF
jgi:transposase/predicted RNA-binding Zn-ribbon protein involved in translation (DUF1610 family)